jgi:putative tricarboxylic transport membrane protein
LIDLEALRSALHILQGSYSAWLLTIPGLALGMIGGAIPGVSSALILAIVLPATLWMSLLSSLIFMTAIYTGSAFGVAIPAILMGVPGSPAAVATAFDGYPMTQRGEHNRALGLALAASTLGHIGAYLILFVGIGPIALAVLQLGPLEMLLLMLWGLTLIAALRGRHMSRSLLSGLIGVLIATIGLSPRDVIRGTFNLPELLDGVPVVPAMIGLFAASELFNLAGTPYLVQRSDLRTVSVRAIAAGLREALQHPIVILRGLVIGATVGGLPGVGAAICNLVSYAETRRGDKDPGSFGKGNPKGVIAAEAGNASSEAGSMATLLALGIPGGASSAVMLAALSLHDVTGGPQFLAASKDVVYAIILNNLAQGVLMLVLGLGLIGLMANVVRIPVRILIPLILVLATFGSYSFTENMTGPIAMVVFGFVGWFMQRHDYSVPACVVGLILGGKVEANLLQTYQISGGGQLDYLLERPIAMVLLALLLFSLFSRPLLQWWRGRATRRHAPPLEGAADRTEG